VRDHKGKHLAGLVKDDFRLEENGREQPISLFEEVQSPVELMPSSVSDQGFSNIPYNSSPEFRLAIFVLDLINTNPIQRTDGREQIIKFLSQGLVPNQTVSVLCLTVAGLKLVHVPSADTKSIIAALRKVQLGAGAIAPARNAMIGTLQQLKQIAQAYVGVPGRKTMIFAAGFIPELIAEGAVLDSDVLAGEVRQMWKSLIEANISVYPFQLLIAAIDPSRRSSPRNPDLGLREFADATGGNRCLESNGFMDCLSQAIEDSRTYYMLAFSVQPNDRKPGWRELKVKVLANHVSIRARNGFYYGPPASDDEKTIHQEEITALASPVAYSAVPMYVKLAANPAPTSAGKTTPVQFLITIPMSGLRVDSTQPNPLNLDIGAIALTNDLREAAEFTLPIRGNPKPDQLQTWTRDGIKLQGKLELPAGSYDMRFFTRDNNAARVGTVIFSLDVK
jgi:VWFA-related protein